MIRLVVNNILRFIFLILLQVLVLNNLQFSGLINPYLYILFILLLPFEIPDWVMLFIGFFTGLLIDVSTDTLGLHTSATVFMTFMRPFILSILSPRDGYDSGTAPKLQLFGLAWFLRYSIILIFIHHFVLFYLEVLRVSDFYYTFMRIILSSFFTILLVLLSQIFMYRRKTEPFVIKKIWLKNMSAHCDQLFSIIAAVNEIVYPVLNLTVWGCFSLVISKHLLIKQHKGKKKYRSFKMHYLANESNPMLPASVLFCALAFITTSLLF